MNRRTLTAARLLLLVSMWVICPSIQAQRLAGTPRIGVIQTGTKAANEALRNGLRELGYVEGRSISIEWRTSTGTETELRSVVADLVQAKASLIVAFGSPATRAVLQTSTLPVVFIAGDPVTSGFAVSLAKPGGNATGVSVLTRDLEPKRLDLLHEVAPRARRVGYLRNNANPLAEQLLEDVRAAARVVKLQIDPLNASTVDELKHTLSIIGRRTPDALIVSPESFFLAHKAEIAQAVRKAKLPTVFPYSDYHADGAFMSYGPNLKTTSRLLATYVDRILRGAKPAELPVEQMSKYDLIIDLRIAHELGIHVPNQMLLRADEVIR